MLKFSICPKKLIKKSVNKKDINEKVTSNKAKHVESEKKLNEFSEKFRLFCIAVRNIRAATIFK